MQRSLEARGVLATDAPSRPGKPTKGEEWLSPTKADLRYGEVVIVKTPAGDSTLVRISSFRSAKGRSPEKRAYRRWHGIDILGFLTSGEKREVRIVQVLKGRRC